MPKVNDLNRQRKIYPLLRQKPMFGEILSDGQAGLIVEVAILPFNNQDTYTYRFEKRCSSSGDS